MSVEIIIAEPHGFCGNDGKFGVSGAIKIAIQAAQDYPGSVYILGELVHNPHVTRWLKEEYQIQTVVSLDQIPRGKVMVVKAHGLSPAVITAARTRNLIIVDATCLLVKQVHHQVLKLVAAGKNIIYLASDLKHEEALGVYGEAPDHIQLVTIDDLENLEILNPEQTVLLSQTTLSILETKDALSTLQKRFPTLKIEPHICPATTQRQTAIIELSKKVDLIIVVGSQTSSNSLRLQEVAARQNKNAYIVGMASEVKPEWFQTDIKKVGLSSGASTPESVLEAVKNRIIEITQ